MKATTPKEFERLSVLVFERTGTLLSPTTLKRLWGYLKVPSTPRMSTLNVLAQCCGWRGYDDFLAGNRPEIESGFVGSRVLNAEKELAVGETVRLMWAPSRVCVIKYLGNSNWIVTQSEKTRLMPGDTFRCPVIIAGEPLYLDNVKHGGFRPGVYVCGRRNGVRFLLVDSSD
ncbi:MAG: hypothetical protein HDR89_02450 [Bacteroides sp.]|nr:hypothetical protein [Bacteroides sp.]